MTSGDVELVADPAAFAALLDDLKGVATLAVDTEFHRERTYFAQLALVQLAFDGRVVVVDPLGVDIAPLATVLTSDTVVIMHACRQDLEILERACGVLPRRLVDTQLAAGFLGMTSPSLSSLVDKELGLKLPKADRLTDWLRRPLTDAQLRYAGSDVAHLAEVWTHLEEGLDARGRRTWFDEAIEELRSEQRGTRDPDEAWRRIKELRHLRSRDLSVARAVAAWRERRAVELDLTPRYVLSDLAVVGVSGARPTTVEELRAVRGVDGRSLRSSTAHELLAVIAAAVANPIHIERHSNEPEMPAELRPAVPLVSAWATQVARDLQIELALLATRADLEELLRGSTGARLATGWRSDALGSSIAELIDGRAALAFERGGGLRLEGRPRSDHRTYPRGT